MINCKQDGWGTVRVRTADGSTWSYHDVPTRHIRFHGWLPAGALLMAAGNGDGGNAPFTLHSGGTRHDLPVMPRPFWVEDVLGYSNDGSRLAVLGVHWSYFCEDFEDITGIRPPFGCKERFMLVVFDSAKKKIISQRPLKNGASWGVLSPDGKRLAIFENHTLFIYRLP